MPTATETTPNLLPLLADMDTRLRFEVDRFVTGGLQHDPFRGLYITDSDVAEVVESLSRGGGAIDWPAVAEQRLARLVARLSLSEPEVRILIAAVLPDLDLRYERVFAYLQDDVTRKRPTVDLLLKLLWNEPSDRLAALPLFHSSGALRRNGIIQLDPEKPQDNSMLARSIRADDRVLCYMLGADDIDDRLRASAYVVRAGGAQPGGLSIQVLDRLDAAVRHHQSGHRTVVIALEGPVGAGKTVAAFELAVRLGLSLLVIDIPSQVRGDLAPQTAAQLSFREAALQGALPYMSGAGALWDEGERAQALRDAFADQHRGSGGPLVMSGRPGFEVPAVLAGIPVIRIALQMPSNLERLVHWTAVVGDELPQEPLHEIAGAFRLTAGQIQDAATVARHQASLRSPPFDQLVPQDLYAGCRAVSSRGLVAVADEITHLASWQDLVLPADSLAQLQELCSTVGSRAIVLDRWRFAEKLTGGTGTTALFAGPSGTGKTMAAGIIARALGLPLYRIDLARVVSKWIGETEKNLDRVFKAAEDSNAVLFLDEADALLGKRSEVRDSHDRYANLEISYLLQKMEEYDGLAILATNMRHLIDEAFTRRLSFTVLFPLPQEADRRLIWRTLWPAELPQEEGVDLDRLARFRLPGGNIRNVLLAAAYLAAAEGSGVAMHHLLHGIKREYQKLGKELTDAELAE